MITTYSVTNQGSVSILHVNGKLTTVETPNFSHQMIDLLNNTEMSLLLIDFATTDFVASSGFRELFTVGRELRRRGSQLAVCNLNGDVKRIFEVAEFQSSYPVYASIEEGIASLSIR